VAVAITNLAEALIQLGDWDAAEAELTQAADSDMVADIEQIRWKRACLAALRGDAGAAETLLTGLPEMAASEDPQPRAGISTLETFTAAARRRPTDALRHARASLARADALGISSESLRWAWPMAVRCAYELDDNAALRDLLALLGSFQPGHLAPMLQAERDLARARLAAADGAETAAASFVAAVASLRERSTPYHLAHGLLDHAEYLLRTDNAEAAAAAIAEAHDIAARLRCQPLMDRAEALIPQDAPRVTS
jgi:hypothetical protein